MNKSFGMILNYTWSLKTSGYSRKTKTRFTLLKLQQEQPCHLNLDASHFLIAKSYPNIFLSILCNFLAALLEWVDALLVILSNVFNWTHLEYINARANDLLVLSFTSMIYMHELLTHTISYPQRMDPVDRPTRQDCIGGEFLSDLSWGNQRHCAAPLYCGKWWGRSRAFEYAL